jgi:hypothetical protein
MWLSATAKVRRAMSLSASFSGFRWNSSTSFYNNQCIAPALLLATYIMLYECCSFYHSENVVTTYGLVGGYQHFQGIYCLHLKNQHLGGAQKVANPQHNRLIYIKMRKMLDNPSSPPPSFPRPLVIEFKKHTHAQLHIISYQHISLQFFHLALASQLIIHLTIV